MGVLLDRPSNVICTVNDFSFFESGKRAFLAFPLWFFLNNIVFYADFWVCAYITLSCVRTSEYVSESDEFAEGQRG